MVTVRPTFSKRYLKYLTKKYLKKQQLRDYLRVMSRDKAVYKVCSFVHCFLFCSLSTSVSMLRLLRLRTSNKRDYFLQSDDISYIVVVLVKTKREMGL